MCYFGCFFCFVLLLLELRFFFKLSAIILYYKKNNGIKSKVAGNVNLGKILFFFKLNEKRILKIVRHDQKKSIIFMLKFK